MLNAGPTGPHTTGAKTLARRRATRPRFEDTLRQAVAASGLSAYALAARSGVAQPVISRFMTGERGLNLTTAEKLCNVVGLELCHRKQRES
jgi:ribosome-binding protein aMBF1 (putative translation factor)